jgi:hypothetical protein
MRALFKEKQKFRKPWLTILLFILCVSTFTALVLGFKSEMPVDVYLLEEIHLVILPLVFFGLLILAIMSKLTIFINQYGIFINFHPFVKNHIVWHSIKKAAIIDCNDIKGYGIRSSKYGTTYKIRGQKGLHIVLKNKKEYLIATRRPEKLDSVLETYRSVHNFI